MRTLSKPGAITMGFDNRGLRLKRPVSVWNRPIRISPRETLVRLAKAAVNGAKAEFDDAFENLADAFVATDLGYDAGQLAWTLIYAALMRAVGDLLRDGMDLFEEAQRRAETSPPDQRRLDELAAMLEDHLAHCVAGIDKDFFRHPERFALLGDFRPGFEHLLAGLGLHDADARALGQRLGSQFPLALHDEWRRRPERLQPILRALESPFAAADERQRQWDQYGAWLDAQVDQRMFGEAFGLRQVYVPLRAYYEEHPPGADPDVGADGDSVDDPGDDPGGDQDTGGWQRGRKAKPRRIVVDLHQHLSAWVERFDPDDNVRLISGGPGSGKSSFARMFASEMAAGRALKVLFIPLHLLMIRDDLVQSVGNFARMDRWLSGNPLDAGGERRLLVIFDGLDELRMQGASAAGGGAQSFVEQVLCLAGLFSAQGFERQFIIIGREIATQANGDPLHRPGQVLQLLPFLVDDKDREGFDDPGGLLRADQRDHWWQRYGAASGRGFASMPGQLRGRHLSDITRQPLLNYLVALSHQRGKLRFGDNIDLNRIYADLLEAVFERQYEGRGHAALEPISCTDFERLLEEIALAIWHGNGRTATDEEISRRCEHGGLAARLAGFREGAEEGVTGLLAAFYFRQAGDLGGERTFEFTHKSFGEYLTARRLVRALQRIQTQLERRAGDPDDGWGPRDALRHLAEVAGPTAMDPDIDGFLRRELAGRDKDTCTRWQRTLASLIEFAVTHGLPMERLALPSFHEMARQARNADETLLVQHAACAAQTGEVVPIRWPGDTSFGTWFKWLQGQRDLELANWHRCQSALNGLDLAGQVLIISDLYRANLRGAKLLGTQLSGAHLNKADLSDADLSRANLSRAKLSGANLIGAKMHGAQLRDAKLRGAKLRRTDLNGADLSRTNLIGADLRDNRLSAANLSGAILSGAHLNDSDLSDSALSSANLSGAILSGAILRGANLNNANLNKANLIGADLIGADLCGAKLRSAALMGANLCDAKLQGADLRGADLSGANLSRADLMGARLSGANLSGADLRQARPRKQLQVLAREDPAQFQGAIFNDPD